MAEEFIDEQRFSYRSLRTCRTSELQYPADPSRTIRLRRHGDVQTFTVILSIFTLQQLALFTLVIFLYILYSYIILIYLVLLQIDKYASIDRLHDYKKFFIPCTHAMYFILWTLLLQATSRAVLGTLVSSTTYIIT